MNILNMHNFYLNILIITDLPSITRVYLSKGKYMELCSPKVIKSVLDECGFTFKKSLGQNFLINPTVCPKMAESAVANGETGVIEIGPGIGVLTAELARAAEKVVSIELDERLRPVLAKTLAEFDNIEVVFGDVMKTDLNEIIKSRFNGGSVSVCANLPYYITSPIIMMLLESRLPITSVTVMVQREAAQRICARVGSRESGAVTVAVNYYSEPELLTEVSRGSFMPPPNVDSAVIRLNIRKQPPVSVKNEKDFFKLVRAAFSQRRKTLVNSVSSVLGISKESVKQAVVSAGLSEDVRAERLSMEQLAAVSNALFC